MLAQINAYSTRSNVLLLIRFASKVTQALGPKSVP